MFFRVKRPRIESNASEDIDASNHNMSNKTKDITENIGETPLSSSHQPPNDIGLYISSTEISNDICSLLLRSHWKPPERFEYPYSTRSDRGKIIKRYLSKNHLQDHDWLELSPSQNGLFCVPCVLFGPATKSVNGQNLSCLVSKPLKRYDKLSGKQGTLCLHEQKKYHKLAVLKSRDFMKNLENNVNISKLIDKGRKKQADLNRKILGSIVKTIMLCGKRNFPLRGKRDDGHLEIYDEDSIIDDITRNNEGNFRELLRFRVDAGDTILKEHLEKSAANATYTSKTIQNEIINVCAGLTREKIVKQLSVNKLFTVLADETTDVSGKEQMSLCVRYVDPTSKKIREDFLDFVHVTDLTGKGLADKILGHLENTGIDINYMVGQGYDGASAMSGHIKGVQKIIQEQIPTAHYVHCASHCLNLVLSKACSIPVIRDAHCTIKSICNFINRSAKRKNILKQCILELGLDTKIQCLTQLCETRWVERHDAVKCFVLLFAALQLFFKKCEHLDNDTSFDASKECDSLKKPGVLVGIAILYSVLSLTISLSIQLQAVEIDLVKAMSDIEDIRNTLKARRNDSKKSFNTIWAEAVRMGKQAGIELECPRTTTHQAHRGNIEASTPEEYFRLNAYIPFLDYMLSQLDDRFSSHNQAIYHFSALLPSLCNKYEYEHLKDGIHLYNNFLSGSDMEIEGEFEIWQTKWVNVKEPPSTAIEALENCDKDVFPNLHTLLVILCTLPVTTATAERSFSGMRRLKTYLRSTMNQTRLTGLAHLHINRNTHITSEEVVNEFATRKRKLDFVL